MTETTQPQGAAKAVEGKHLTFQLADARYGIDILQVQEIISVPPITRVPKAPPYIKGVINLRGRIIPVMDLRSRLGLDSISFDEKTCIIVVNINKDGEKIALGVIVDTVLEVLNFASEDIEPAPDYGVSIETTFIRGIGRKTSESLNILIDIDQLLTGAEKGEIAGVK